MDLYVVRHGIAEERREGLRDADRQLTPKGRKRFRRCVEGLAALEVRLERVLTSPWSRAAQTAALLAPLAEAAPAVEDGLIRDPDEALLAALAETEAARLAVVGHEPWLSELTDWLVTGAREGDPRFVLKKGGVAHLRGEPTPGGMELRALLPPKALVAIAKG
jgi:phosphohistidine phosphatase